ncbi:MAG: tetratricopeptide repeat protein [Treponema sp.]|nr:tetratricopeptide repeat protein [Treponema sp.]
MPGLSQLIQFNKDILSLGDEIQLRGQRGEKPVRVPVPKNIPDVDDSDEFVMGMPENEAIIQDTSVDDDLSDLQAITGIGTPSTSDSSSETSDTSSPFETPDMSDLLTPLPASDTFGEATDMPDLSMFEEQPEEEIIEEEPEEPSIADLSLEDLLGGAGFDGTSSPEFDPSANSSSVTDEDLDFYSGGFGDENYVPQKKEKKSQKEPDLSDFSDLTESDILSEIPGFEADVSTSDSQPDGDALSLDELGLGDLTLDNPSEPEELGEIEEPGEIEELSDISDLGETEELSDIDDLGEAEELSDISDLGEAEELGDLTEDIPDITSGESDFEIPEAPADFGESTDFEEAAPISESADLSEPFDFTTDSDDSLEPLDFSENFDTSLDTPEEESAFDIPETSLDSSNLDLDTTDLDTPDLSTDLDFDLDSNLDIDAASDLDQMEEPNAEEALLSGDLFDMPETIEETEPISETIENPIETSLEETAPELEEGFGSDFESAENLDSFDIDGLPDMDSSIDSLDSFSDDIPETPSKEMDFSMDIDDMGDFEDISATDSSSDELSDGISDDFSVESFDTSEMEGMDFGIPETDLQMEGDSSADGLSDDFSLDDQDFSIPGFSDVETAKDEKRGTSLLSTKQGKKSEEEKLPPNTLSDAQYKVFLKNLSEYPLNVRLAFEDLIVKNEFTDDAEFEIVEKILNKAPARQVASLLEKMLDISLPVPSNYEHRTAEEYEAYKKSLTYQLKNKIIPAIFACMVMLVVGFGLFKFTKNCIYTPIKANSLYKQGYAMLQADEYPQSEIKFNEARKYRLSKKWFFTYARGYRERKQFIRAEWMYQNILDYFKHDKTAGLEYANMELNDLANYEKAEEICRRQVLDFHINDADGILLLGDVFLEWGTEKNPEKLESAREQYATLIQLYKSNMLYEGRMMRYFIRTDNLPEVLTLKEYFLPKEKNLPPEDWTELSGYMLDKLYGPMSPSEEYLRSYIEDVRLLLARAYKLDSKNPVAAYNIARYFIETNENQASKDTLKDALEKFNKTSQLKRRDLYKYIDTYRLAGEEYAKAQEYLRAQEFYTDGITLYTAEHNASGLEGNKKIGQLFSDQADMDYFITGDYDNALLNYISSVELENDNPSIRYKIGYIQYKKKNYGEALGSFMKAGDGNIKETNLMLAMGNTLSLRGDNYAAQGYYEDLIANLDRQIADKGSVNPQVAREDNELVTTYLYASNNYGVTLYKLASRTGNSAFNADAIVQFSQSVRAWDALTRNQITMERLGGSNLAEENIKYITHPVPDFEPAIYTEIPRTIINNEKISY